jgi:predicted site-specific integrase-resolvase
MSSFINQGEVAALFGVSRATVANWCKTGELQEGMHWRRMGAKLYFNKAELLKLLPGSEVTK